MNLKFILSLIKGKDTYDTIVKVLNVIAGFVAGADSNNTGNDDLLAGALTAVAHGVEAYGVKDNNEEGNIVDGLIAALQSYREEAVKLGRITTFNQ
jgi:hypothetical protein